MSTKQRIGTSIIAAVLILLFGLLYKVWGGFLYFVLVLGTLLAIYWFVCIVLDYHEEYNKRKMEEKFAFYCSVKVNQTNLTMDIMQKSRKFYFKKFKRTLLKEKSFFLIKMIFTLGIGFALIYFMF